MTNREKDNFYRNLLHQLNSIEISFESDIETNRHHSAYFLDIAAYKFLDIRELEFLILSTETTKFDFKFLKLIETKCISIITLFRNNLVNIPVKKSVYSVYNWGFDINYPKPRGNAMLLHIVNDDVTNYPDLHEFGLPLGFQSFRQCCKSCDYPVPLSPLFYKEENFCRCLVEKLRLIHSFEIITTHYIADKCQEILDLITIEPTADDNQNPHPRIFEDSYSYNLFLKMNEYYSSNKNDVANYSFLFYAMQNDNFIICGNKEFIEFLSSIYIYIDRIDSRQSGTNNKYDLYNLHKSSNK
ncbi:hypothetical protein [Psychroserpens burtonensis]|uniref:hypothetical protein n=1 Tax=Psychroserpens burtonensis TaxID=49278 RepID=UPI0003FE913C|nr:hypothetical protein [Psychroserpens burtonensis]